jgi:hypothetical protein
MGSNDKISLSNYTESSSSTVANNALLNSIFTSISASTAANTGALRDNGVLTIRGYYNDEQHNFQGSAVGTDMLVVYDANSSSGTTAFEAIVLVGCGSNTLSINSGSGGVITLI